MSEIKCYSDSFIDQRNWNGISRYSPYLYNGSAVIEADTITSIRNFYKSLSKIEFIFYDDTSLDYAFYLEGGSKTFTITAETTGTNAGYYVFYSSGGVNEGRVARVSGWNTLTIYLKESFEIDITDSLGTWEIAKSSELVIPYFKFKITGRVPCGQFNVYRNVGDEDFIPGAGMSDDIEQQSIIASGTGDYPVVNPGYFYIDNQEHYLFADMGVEELDAPPSGVFPSGIIEANPSGTWDYVSSGALDYILGSPYFVVSEDDYVSISGSVSDKIMTGSGYIFGDYVKVPEDKKYKVEWNDDISGYIPTVKDYYDNFLVYEKGERRTVDNELPFSTSKLVLTDMEGELDEVRTSSSYIDFASTGDTIEFWALVTDEYEGPKENTEVKWYEIREDDTVDHFDTTYTNESGIATTTFTATATITGFHIYAEAIGSSVLSEPRWIQTPVTPSALAADIFQLDSDSIWDTQQARTATGLNCFAGSGVMYEFWGTNVSGITEVDDPATHGDWEDDHDYLRRPPILSGAWMEDDGLWTDTGYDETNGIFTSVDFNSGVTIGGGTEGDIINWMNDNYVTPEAYWGQAIVTGSQIKGYGGGNCQNGAVDYPVYFGDDDAEPLYSDCEKDSFDDINASGDSKYNTVFYVIYFPFSTGTGPYDWNSDNFYFRGMAIYPTDSDDVLNYRNQTFRVENYLSTSYLED